MSTAQRLQEAGVRYFADPPKTYKDSAYYCLAFMRVIIQAAYGISYDHFYTKVVDQRVERNNNQPAYWIARDAERSMRSKGWAVSNSSQSFSIGEIHFDYRAFKNKYGIYEGHVRMFLGALPLFIDGEWQRKWVCIENADPKWRIKDGSYLANNGNIVLVDLKKTKPPTTRILLPEDL